MTNSEAICEFKEGLKMTDKNDIRYKDLLNTAIKSLERDEAVFVKFWGNQEEECNADCPKCGQMIVDGYIGLPEGINYCHKCGQKLMWRA